MRRLRRLWLALLLTGAAAAQTITLAPSNPGSAGAIGNLLSVTSVTNGVITMAPSGVTISSGVLTFNNGQMNLLNALSGTTLAYELNEGVVVGDATSAGNLLSDAATNDVVLINSSGSNKVLLGILANHSAEQISSTAVGFSLPVTLPSLVVNGATADTSLSSGTASNTDLNGILAVVSATTASYSFQRTTAYTSHPICLAEEEGSTPAAVSVSYTGVASVTFHFASFTGNVDYICTGQN